MENMVDNEITMGTKSIPIIPNIFSCTRTYYKETLFTQSNTVMKNHCISLSGSINPNQVVAEKSELQGKALKTKTIW